MFRSALARYRLAQHLAAEARAPRQEPALVVGFVPATAAQVGYVEALSRRIEESGGSVQVDVTGLSRTDISAVIDQLLHARAIQRGEAS